ncbi:uncharacterized protein LOC141595185 [Silene latifolia]|uniref:uncharacterized protein LOC141595185 n=1 Tax=Silene latifolia TaxID=37657 RepID=UPI003D76B53D
MNQDFPMMIEFLDESAKEQTVRLEYEWLPITCGKCNGIGHSLEQCRGQKQQQPCPKQVWKPAVSRPIARKHAAKVSPSVVTPIPPPGWSKPTIPTPARVFTRFSRQGPDLPSSSSAMPGLTFMDSLNAALQRPIRKMDGRRGLNSLTKQKDIKWFLHQNNVGLFSLLETRTIFSEVTDNVRGFKFKLTVVYDFNKLAERKDLWKSIIKYAHWGTGPWMIYGYFNNVMYPDERIGTDISWAEIRQFHDTCNSSNLHTIKTMGAFFTWNNKHKVGIRVFSRIDRVLHNDDWLIEYPDSVAHFLPEGLYDHSPCIISMREQYLSSPKGFRYFNMWEGFQNIEHTFKVAEKALFCIQEELNRNPTDVILNDNEKVASQEVQNLLKAKQMFLSQKANLQCVLEGEDNSAYFHSVIKKRRWLRRSRILWCLLGKAAGPDGFSGQFFKDARGTVVDSVIAAVKDFFESGKLLKQVNHTILTLIPKVELPFNVSQFRPIACCNVVYKCITKVLCNRLSLVLPDLVSENQSAFVKNRDNVENILVCQDLVKLYKRKSCSPRILMKIDLQKAYDSIEWSFVRGMMEAMDFPEMFTSRVMECVYTPTFSISLNGGTFGFFKGRRGLRQGEPMSPLLFTLCMDYLSRIICVAQEIQSYKYHSLCKKSKLSHMCFAYDLLLVCHGNLTSVDILINSFEVFSKASGLKMNVWKSNVYVNGVDSALQAKIIARTVLVERVVSRIRAMGARKLSYGGRLTLVQSVLTHLHNYWASIFILPKGVLKMGILGCRMTKLRYNGELWFGLDMVLFAAGFRLVGDQYSLAINDTVVD